jgi:hypothetical protein
MRHLLVPLAMTLQLAWSAPGPQTKTAKEPAKKSSQNAAEKARSAVKTLTGCLDQQGEGYVLRELRTAGAVSALKGKAFSDDNFARYVGHKVTVHGTMEKEGGRSVLHVTKVDDAGPGCSNQ